jgi:hypothetical protein
VTTTFSSKMSFMYLSRACSQDRHATKSCTREESQWLQPL